MGPTSKGKGSGSKEKTPQNAPSRDRDVGRKYVDGATKARKRKQRDDFLASQKGALDKFAKKSNLEPTKETSPSSTSTDKPSLAVASASTLLNKNVDTTAISVSGNNDNAANTGISLTSPPPSSLNAAKTLPPDLSTGTTINELALPGEPGVASGESEPSIPIPQGRADLNDPGQWPDQIDAATREYLVEMGPPKIPKNCQFPKYKDGRHFSREFLDCKLVNGETVARTWLIYSKTKNAVFCFCCRLFGGSSDQASVSLGSKDGYSDWRHCGRSLKAHQRSADHFKSFAKWTDLSARLRRHSTINQAHADMVNAEKKHWQDVLTRIIASVQYLAETNSAFRGSSCILFERENGNFLKLMEMLANFDGPMKEHLRRVRDEKTYVHYLGPRIQNEIISMLGAATKEKLLDAVRAAKYYAVILDCTPDLSHKEQMTLVLRYVNMAETPRIVESFIEFLKVDDTTGEGLTEVLEKALEENYLDIMDCRGQGYDNGANMKAKYKGVQTRVKTINKRAMFMACVAHNLNLLLGDMVKCNKDAMTFFGVVQRIYTLFVASTERWRILCDLCPDLLTLKSLSSTRWECRIDSVKPLRYQLREVNEAIEKVAEITKDPVTRSEAQSLLLHTRSYEFALSLVIWYDLLFSVNSTSKTLQSESTSLDTPLTELQGLKLFSQNYRNTGFNSAMSTAREIMENLGSDVKFSIRRQVNRKRFFDERIQQNDQRMEKTGEDLQKEAEDRFRVNYFLSVVDTALSCVENRFNEVTYFSEYFGFLFDPSELCNFQEEQLKNQSQKLSNFLKDGEHQDLDAEDLFLELKLFRYAIPSSVKSALGALRYLAPIRESYPNVTTAYRILLTIPITVASGERSFSILKLIKNYLRSTMAQERLNGLATLSIECETAKKLDISNLINSFALAKARRAPIK